MKKLLFVTLLIFFTIPNLLFSMEQNSQKVLFSKIQSDLDSIITEWKSFLKVRGMYSKSHQEGADQYNSHLLQTLSLQKEILDKKIQEFQRIVKTKLTINLIKELLAQQYVKNCITFRQYLELIMTQNRHSSDFLPCNIAEIIKQLQYIDAKN